MTIHDISVDGVLGNRSWGDRMEGADKSTELWQHPYVINVVKPKRRKSS